ncbi:hypothetical protein Droror1_Dr00023853 [Drosera rotundifolia]
MSGFVEKAAAKHFTSEFPFFVRVMNFSNITGNGTFKLPAQFSTVHLPKIRTKVVIQNVKGECWIVTSILFVRSHTLQHTFCAGWRAFVRDNSIKMGDVCIFEKELAYDYGYALDSMIGPDDKIKVFPCLCGVARCRKRLY